jgi:hypothetical protein
MTNPVANFVLASGGKRTKNVLITIKPEGSRKGNRRRQAGGRWNLQGKARERTKAFIESHNFF